MQMKCGSQSINQPTLYDIQKGVVLLCKCSYGMIGLESDGQSKHSHNAVHGLVLPPNSTAPYMSDIHTNKMEVFLSPYFSLPGLISTVRNPQAYGFLVQCSIHRCQWPRIMFRSTITASFPNILASFPGNTGAGASVQQSPPTDYTCLAHNLVRLCHHNTGREYISFHSNKMLVGESGSEAGLGMRLVLE